MEETTRKTRRRLNYEDRIYIQTQLQQSKRVVEIAEVIGVTRSAIYKELKRGRVDGQYDADYAQKSLYRQNSKLSEQTD